MPYTRIKGTRIVNRIRRVLDQVPFTNESVDTPSHVVGSPSTRFSTEELVDIINRAVSVIVSRCKAMHVYNAIKTEAPTSMPDTPAGAVFRVLESRVFYGDDAARARRRNVDAHRRINRSGRQPTTARPVFTYEDGEIHVYPDTNTGANAYKYRYVGLPTAVPDNASGDLGIDERFEAAVVYYVVAMCYQKLKRPDLYEFAYQVFLDEIDPYTLPKRTNVVDDVEVEIE